MKMKLLVLLLPLFSGSALAQESYKCMVNGSAVYLDRPCPGAARRADSMPNKQSSDGYSSASGDQNPIALGKQLCREMGPKYVAWKDPESLRIGDVFGGKTTVIEFGLGKEGAREFFVEVSAKNSYGAYTGMKTMICYTSLDGRRVMKINDILL